MNLILSIISGVLIALSFPTVFGSVAFPNMGFLAWVSLAPLFFVIRNVSPRKAFLFTVLSFVVAYSISWWWVFTALNTFGHLDPFVSLLVMALLIVFYSAFVALAPMLAVWTSRRLKIDMYWLLPVFWTMMEFVRNYFPFNGFPWGSITNTQFAYLPIIQMTDITGIYGLTFLIVLVNWFVMMCLDRSAFSRSKGKSSLLKGSIVIALLLFTVIYGFYRISFIDREQGLWPSIRVAMLQGNIPQDEKWQSGAEERQLEPYRRYTKMLSSGGADLVIWPEASYPFIVPENVDTIEPAMLGLGENPGKNTFTLFGALTSSGEGHARSLFNSMILVDSGGSIIGRYNKSHLVPFGEYVPYKKLLFFVDKLVAPIGNFASGEKVVPIFTDDYQIGGLVCYEDIFPEISRATVAEGANFLAAITNDAWYGRSSAPFQHLAISVFRSVENRRWMVKSANSGVSAVIDATGRMISKTGLFEQGLIVSNIKLGSGMSLYTRYGDWFALSCSFACSLLIMAALMSGFKKRKRKI